eukprot:9250544-Pyramimonas_sp.AAC.1
MSPTLAAYSGPWKLPVRPSLPRLRRTAQSARRLRAQRRRLHPRVQRRIRGALDVEIQALPAPVRPEPWAKMGSQLQDIIRLRGGAHLGRSRCN